MLILPTACQERHERCCALSLCLDDVRDEFHRALSLLCLHLNRNEILKKWSRILYQSCYAHSKVIYSNDSALITVPTVLFTVLALLKI